MVAVTDKAIEKLKVMISSGELRPGQRLPREPDLAASLGLSRSSLREAVRALSLVRILDVRQGDGTYVSDLSAESLVDTLSFIVEFQHDSSVLELLEVRRILEPAACARAATEISNDALAELEKILDLVTIHSPVVELVAADVQFHAAIAGAGVARHHPGGLRSEDPLRAPGDIRGSPCPRRPTGQHVVNDPYSRG